MSSKTITRIGPADQGRRMSLEEFEHAEAEGERLYELSRGVITVVDVPKPRHLKLFDALHQQFSDFKSKHPKLIYAIAGGGECKLLIADLESERHPDLAIYKTPPRRGRTTMRSGPSGCRRSSSRWFLPAPGIATTRRSQKNTCDWVLASTGSSMRTKD